MQALSFPPFTKHAKDGGIHLFGMENGDQKLGHPTMYPRPERGPALARVVWLRVTVKMV